MSSGRVSLSVGASANTPYHCEDPPAAPSSGPRSVTRRGRYISEGTASSASLIKHVEFLSIRSLRQVAEVLMLRSCGGPPRQEIRGSPKKNKDRQTTMTQRYLLQLHRRSHLRALRA
jgi:hypothetical protein